MSHLCGAKTIKQKGCRRKVAAAGKSCHQHGGPRKAGGSSSKKRGVSRAAVWAAWRKAPMTRRGRKVDLAKKGKLVSRAKFIALKGKARAAVDVAGFDDGGKFGLGKGKRVYSLASLKKARAARKKKPGAVRKKKAASGWKYKDHGHFPMHRRRPKA